MFITYGLMVCKVLLHLMVAHMTGQKFVPFRASIIAGCASVYLWFFTPLRFIVPEICFYCFTFCFSVLCIIIVRGVAYAQLVMQLVKELKKILGIDVFVIKPHK